MNSILELLNHKEIQTTVQLAKALNTSVEIIQAKLERYEQLGYIKKIVYTKNCSQYCSKCHCCSEIESGIFTAVYWERIQ